MMQATSTELLLGKFKSCDTCIEFTRTIINALIQGMPCYTLTHNALFKYQLICSELSICAQTLENGVSLLKESVFNAYPEKWNALYQKFMAMTRQYRMLPSIKNLEMDANASSVSSIKDYATQLYNGREQMEHSIDCSLRNMEVSLKHLAVSHPYRCTNAMEILKNTITKHDLVVPKTPNYEQLMVYPNLGEIVTRFSNTPTPDKLVALLLKEISAKEIKDEISIARFVHLCYNFWYNDKEKTSQTGRNKHPFIRNKEDEAFAIRMSKALYEWFVTESEDITNMDFVRGKQKVYNITKFDITMGILCVFRETGLDVADDNMSAYYEFLTNKCGIFPNHRLDDFIRNYKDLRKLDKKFYTQTEGDIQKRLKCCSNAKKIKKVRRISRACENVLKRWKEIEPELNPKHQPL